MTWDSILEWALPVIGGGGIGSAITFLGTYKSKIRIEKTVYWDSCTLSFLN